MGIIDSIGNLVMKSRIEDLENSINNPHETQQKVLHQLLGSTKDTFYGKKFHFKDIHNYRQFIEQVPLNSYEDLYPYIELILKGENNVLWPTPIKWFAKSSGTTGATSKIIPVSTEGLEQCHYQGGRDMLALYIRNYPDAKLFSGKNLSIGGSQEAKHSSNNSHYIANISAIVMKNLPFWAQFGRTPGLEVTMMNNWEEKIEKIAEITSQQKVTSLAGSPMWMLLLLQHIIKEQKITHIQDVWPDLEVFFHGSVSFAPYRPLFEELDRNKSLRYLEIFNATEGFFGLQDQKEDPSLLLMLNYGIYYEFIPEKEFLSENPKVIPLSEVEMGKNYSMVISTNSGLWRYKIGDTVKFTSTSPYRFTISGRTKHCINVFGEDLFAEHAEKAISKACRETGAILRDFTAAPYFYDRRKKGYHEWLIEFVRSPENIQAFTEILDIELGIYNDDYASKRKNDIAIEKPVVREMPEGTFYEWLKRKNKLGGQHKVPRLSNSREFVEELLSIRKSLQPEV
ncbi:GH3 auxin-responsive promoter family protein [Salinimicrobium sediminilitoris]|uniref:GH3 auxin-responsive promoter family protein n=1 Tax=Salinimicrobium sediminilitoris TaxID=2876715 RepID=UPI001E551D82|nr:GH3 auxin-responsive promoter family protein [Salinimicrobium sediminilitoris]MCC8358859.1 GH3 auxin-responsive promoter family protein [Salinimicrobium sediminilitoris]